jgi:phosphoribosylformylglycinamidine cyclo-ligase
MAEPITYEMRGVSPDKPDVHKAIAALDPGLFPGAFCRLVPDHLGDDAAMCVGLHADGVGSKSIVAHLMAIETGSARWFRTLAQDSLVMNTDDLLCVGAVGPWIVSNTIGRNPRFVGAEALAEIIAGHVDFAAMLAGQGLRMELCGGETADIGDLVRTVVIDSTIAVRMRRDAVIDASAVRPGHVIVALASDGRATYEDRPNSGMGTNGLTSARHDLLSAYHRDRAESFDPALGDRAYTGRFRVTDPLPDGDGMSIGEALLSPTRTYAPIVARLLADGRAGGRAGISALFHNTGGGLTKCLGFGRGVRYVKDDPFPLPPLFRLLAAESRLPARELARTWNLGQRFEVVCDPALAPRVIALSESFGVAAKVIGRVEAIAGDGVEVDVAVAGERIAFARAAKG